MQGAYCTFEAKSAPLNHTDNAVIAAPAGVVVVAIEGEEAVKAKILLVGMTYGLYCLYVLPGMRLLLGCPCDSFKLNTDSLRLQQLLINLLTKAAKFTEKSKIELSVLIEEEQRQVRFVVTCS